MKYLVALAILIISGLAFNPSMARAQMQVPPVPKNSYVLDQTNTLSEDEVQKLNQKIADYRERTSVQLAVLMVPTITDDYLENFSLNVARTWGVGEAGKNNGALLLVVKNDRTMRIEVGTGLEGDLTDLRAGRIIRDRIAPLFKNGNFYGGIYAGLEGMSLAIGNEPDPQLRNEDQSKDGWMSHLEEIIMGIFWVGFIGVSWLGSILGRSKRWWPGGIIGGIAGGGAGYFITQGSALFAIITALSIGILGLLFDFFVSKNYHNAKESGSSPAWWAGGSSFGGGGGGGGSFGGGFGGGGFGGGGSSGSW